MRDKLLLFCLVISVASCNRDKSNEAKIASSQSDSSIGNTKEQQETIDSLVSVYDSVNRVIRFRDYGHTPENDLLYVMTHSRISHGSGFSDLQIRINELKRNIEDKQKANEGIKSWQDSINGITKRNKTQSADIIQVTMDYETYNREITVIHYTDSTKVISRLFVCDSMGGHCKMVSKEDKRITKKQWEGLEQKTYVAHFWQMELNELGMMIGDASFWTIKACIINNKDEITNYHEIEIIGPSGSLEDIGNYIEQLLPQKLLPDYEIPHRRHHNC